MDDHCNSLGSISEVFSLKNQVLGDGARALNAVALQPERHRHHSGPHELPLLWHESGCPTGNLQEKLP
jgi:hypothetical protein